jgi:hypothetical protein
MNLLLVFIAVIFAASWLPLNIFNILSDSKVTVLKADHFFYIINAICILFGMSSAVSNPILYGVLNENFKREYKRLFFNLFSRLFGKCKRSGGTLNKTISNFELKNVNNKTVIKGNINDNNVANANTVTNNNVVTNKHNNDRKSIITNHDKDLIEQNNLKGSHDDNIINHDDLYNGYITDIACITDV